MKIFKTTPEINFLGKKKIAMIFSTILLLATVVGLTMKGLTLGIDFRGGTLIQIQFQGYSGALLERFLGYPGQIPENSVDVYRFIDALPALGEAGQFSDNLGHPPNLLPYDAQIFLGGFISGELAREDT